ncbi:MAG: hypothetical protein ABJC89_15935, partial [Acidobacteriota bacterium]
DRDGRSRHNGTDGPGVQQIARGCAVPAAQAELIQAPCGLHYRLSLLLPHLRRKSFSLPVTPGAIRFSL